MHFYIGLDIGGTKIEATAVNSGLEPLATAVVSTDIAAPAAIVASIEQAVLATLAEADVQPQQLQAIGGGVPGQVDHEQGIVRNAVNLRLTNFPLSATLTKRFNCPVVLENDVRLAAVGAYHHLRRDDRTRFRDLTSLAYISIGTGLAVGLILNGRLYRGSQGMAGELGHVQVDPTGPLCNCGALGCVETYVSGPGLVQQAHGLLADYPASALCDHAGPLTARDIFVAAAAADSAAQAAVDRFAGQIARLLYSAMLAYDVEYLVLGGGVVKAGPLLLNAIYQEIDQLRATLPLAKALLHPERIIAITDYNMGVWGGIMLATTARLDQEKRHNDLQFSAK